MPRKIYDSIEAQAIARKTQHSAIIEELSAPIEPIDNEDPNDYLKRKDEAQQKLRRYMKQVRLWNAVRGF
jgi:hypothetical protein